MPEPERKIEKLLRTFARRRREEAGEPFQMHPATRNLLQREVARRAKATPPKENFLARIFSVPRPRLVFAVSVLALVAVTAGLLIPSLTKQKRAESLAQVRQNEMTRTKAPAEAPGKRELAAGKSAETKADRFYRDLPQPATPPPVVAAAPITKSEATFDKTKRVADEGKILAGNSAVTVAGVGQSANRDAERKPAEGSLKQNLPELAAAPDRLVRVGPEGAKEKIAPVTNSFAFTENSPRRQLAESSDLRDNKTKLGAVTDGVNLNVAVSSNLGNFARVDADELLNRQTPAAVGGKLSTSGTAVHLAKTTDAFRFENRKGLNGKDAAAQAVLVSFQVVQAGDEVRVIDGDGSVYSGRFETPPTERARLFYKTESAGKKLSEPKDADREKSGRAETAAAIPTSVPVTPAQSFQVVGTNRTLNAAVILNGRFLDDTNVLFADKLDLAGRKVDGRSATNFAPAQFLNSRISGTARVGGTEIPIEARRVAP